MADNIILNQGTGGDTLAAYDDASAKHQRVQLTQAGTDVSASAPLQVGSPAKTDLIYRYLDTNGNGTGVSNAAVDHSSAVQQYYIAPDPGEVFHIARMIVSIEDTSGMTAQEYGNLGSALTNGVEIKKMKGASLPLIDLSAGVPIQTNAQWGALCYDVDLKTWGVGDELLVVRWTFDKSGGSLRLDSANGERLSVFLNDDFSGLITHRFMVQGYVV